MSEDTQGREDDCQIASFDSSLPQIVYMDYKRNHKDKLNGIWQSWNIEDIFSMTLDIHSGYIGSGMSIFGDS
ncbi:hypothetical protein Goshw_012499 [Gossypium schwendimanii]|uniref:Uncharacterized protein n=1 Tax=Gossypium schwendimanii TaxID=34291 RepID=A0A7J9L375_GOSSC|nr:hypothetical protein [Gossypium schwendimanii]